MIGSVPKQRKFALRLRARGFSDEQIARLRTPLGMPIGAQTPEEIAVSAMGEIVAVAAPRSRTGAAAARARAHAGGEPSRPAARRRDPRRAVIVGVISPAGASRRMGGKLVGTRQGSSRARRSCEHVRLGDRGACAGAASVWRAVESELEASLASGTFRQATRGARGAGRHALELRFVVNARWARGMLGSARVGLKRALALEPAAVLVLPVDHPDVHPKTVRALAEAMEQALGAYGARRAARGGFAYAVIPRVRGRRGHPIALSPALARRVVADAGAETLSDAVRRRARPVGYFDTRDPGVVRNRNTPRD